MKKIKVLHIVSGNLTGGAARGALWLNEGLRKIGVDSKILSNSQIRIETPEVSYVNKTKLGVLHNKFLYHIDKLPLKLYLGRGSHSYSTSIYGYDFTKHELYNWADIINLHWINAGFINIKHLRKIKKPIVWTLRDMWPLTGGCHYSLECNRFIEGCGKCPQLSSKKEKDLSYYLIKRKKKFYPQHLKFVGISNWISDMAKESYLLKDFDINTIYNNVNCEEFVAIDKSTARRLLNLNSEKTVVLIGATSINYYYKGFSKFIEAAERLDKDKYNFVYFGKANNEFMENLGFDFKYLGYLDNNTMLSLAYSAADVFVAPSLMESFGKTIVESMSCGTPVVCFDATGPKDIVDHKINGYKASPFNAVDLKDGIEWIANHENYEDLRQSAIDKAHAVFSSKQIAQQYVSLYEELIDSC